MTFVPFDNVIKLEAIFLSDGQRCENVHHYLVDETPNVDTAQDLAEAYISWWDVSMQPNVSNSASLVLVRCTIMETETSPGIETSVGLPLVGGLAQEQMPNNVTLAVKWTTGLRGRSYRGRTYHIGLPDDAVITNTVGSVPLSSLLNAYGLLIALNVDVGPAVMCIASRFHNGVERTTGVATPVIDVSIDSTVDSQRRRLPGRGR